MWETIVAGAGYAIGFTIGIVIIGIGLLIIGLMCELIFGGH